MVVFGWSSHCDVINVPALHDRLSTSETMQNIQMSELCSTNKHYQLEFIKIYLKVFLVLHNSFILMSYVHQSTR